MEILIRVLETPGVLAAIVTLGAYVLARWVKPREKVWKYHEFALACIAFAEKEIPDDTPNKSLKRLEVAMKYLAEMIEKAETDPAEAELKKQIIKIHNTEKKEVVK